MGYQELLDLGLTDEQATTVYNKLESQQMIPKARFDEVNNAKKALETQVADYDTQLKTLQKSAEGNEALQAEIKALQEAQTTVKTKYEQDLKDAKVDAAIQLALAGKVHDAELVSGLVDRATIQVGEDGKIVGGLDEQLTSLKETKTFLFVPEAPATPQQPTLVGVVPVVPGGQPPQPLSLGAQMAQKMNATKTTKAPSSVWGQ